MTVHILVACILLFFALGGLSIHHWQPTYWWAGVIASVVAILGLFLIVVGMIHI